MEMKSILSRNKKGAMEMSVGTIVTIVLLMSVLVLGIFLVQKIFSTGTSAIDQVDDQVQNKINELFADGDQKLIIFPPSGSVEVVKGETPPKGFAFSIENPQSEEQNFEYEATIQDADKCNQLTPEELKSWMLGDEGNVLLGPDQQMERGRSVVFEVPENAEECTFEVDLSVKGDQGFARNRQIIVSIVSGGGLV